MSNAWITTFTGKQFFPFDPNPDDIDILDIAHSLSNLCRHLGHCSPFYSVAEHSLRLLELVPVKDQLEALLHDAAEAYTTDIPTLMKAELPMLQEAEERLTRLIFEKFGANLNSLEGIEKIEKGALLSTEVRDLMPNDIGWNLTEPPLFSIIYPGVSRQAERRFLRAFRQLTKDKMPRR